MKINTNAKNNSTPSNVRNIKNWNYEMKTNCAIFKQFNWADFAPSESIGTITPRDIAGKNGFGIYGANANLGLTNNAKAIIVSYDNQFLLYGNEEAMQVIALQTEAEVQEANKWYYINFSTYAILGEAETPYFDDYTSLLDGVEDLTNFNVIVESGTVAITLEENNKQYTQLNVLVLNSNRVKKNDVWPKMQSGCSIFYNGILYNKANGFVPVDDFNYVAVGKEEITGKPTLLTLSFSTSGDDLVFTTGEEYIGGSALPTPIANKYLHADANGDLEWVDAGGGHLYLHRLYVAGSNTSNDYPRGQITIINNDSTPFTYGSLRAYLYNNGFTSSGYLFMCDGATKGNLAFGIWANTASINMVKMQNASEYSCDTQGQTVMYANSAGPIQIS